MVESWSELSALLGELGIGALAPGPWLVIAAHPDDDVIGASWVLRRHPEVHVLYLTDGAPKNPRLWSTKAPRTRADYARQRRGEARRALALAQVANERIHDLGFVDQELCHELERLTATLASVVRALAPRVVLVQPYEGGHPDHDAAAFAAQAALRLLGGRAPVLLEMTSYHLRDGALRTGEFLAPRGFVVERTLSASDRDSKARMFDCHRSQRDVLSAFALEGELYRRAPRYDFGAPPHAPPLHYESLDFGIDHGRWCELARRADERLASSEVSPEARAC